MEVTAAAAQAATYTNSKSLAEQINDYLAATKTSIATLASEIPGYSRPTISRYLSGKYEGDITTIEMLLADWLAGRTVGMLALELLLLCFAVSAVMQLYFKNSAANFALIASAAALLVLTLDWLFFYYMPGYSGAASRWLWFVLPTAVLSVPVCFPLFGVVRRIHEEFKIDNGVV